MKERGQDGAVKRFFCKGRRVCAAICCVLCALLGLTHSPFASHAKGTSLALSAASAALYEPFTGQFFYTKNADTPRPMASTTKIMTGLVAIENAQLTDLVTISARAVGVEGSSVYLQARERVTIETLLYALLLQSANDAAAALAIAIGGSIEGFADMMNARAEEMGLTQTHFENPHGLHHPNHYTTAKELAIIAGEAMKNPTFRRIVSTKKVTVTLHDGEVSRVLCNHNRLLNMYEGCIGVKTGFTKTSGRCLVSAAERDGLCLIAVTLNAPNDWQDHKKLFDYGFASYERACLAQQEAYTIQAPVLGGKKDTVMLQNAHPLSAVIPRGSHCTLQVQLSSRPLVAPLSQGEHVGELVAISDGKVVGRTPLMAAESIPKFKSKKG